MTDAKSYWERYYAEKKFVDGKAPNSFLVDMLPRLQKGKVLDVAMGEGSNACYLAQKGFEVKGFDISKTAVERAKSLAKEMSLELDAQQADLDLYLMGLMEYDSIIMTYFRPGVTRYYSNIISALKQGGTLLVHSYSQQQMNEAIGRDEDYRNFYFSSNEILKNLSGMKILFYQEGLIDGKHIVQCLAQKPVEKDAAKLGLFDMHTKGHDKSKSKQLELAENLFKK
ncbi:class I SAM-dependent methyltransferase [Pseudobacteriovorax antillogorgiicola]|uniref:Methyltransferase domain-containing protein n=1 Tax=Pseudobacteriovorax antillogorgiicola TaxID=1513793 RepID=A0A1Y6C769_9BACT|nr:class I SAM-dependent methyltransferase [Pseudobacteriovorax antillogorgiicola]TCS50646.1 methyltransferase family protein [Pseudobacteriovorax antillogorgiicola]SMF39661.1 Methyltransferase domain-containing protein [Pseudobacteriovorax antillogorgiicola]